MPCCQLYESVLAADPTSTEAHYLCGLACHALGDLERAEDLLRRAVRLDPNHAESHHLLAVVLSNQKRFDEAIDSLQCACASPRFPGD